jgi:hypothetical protein
VVKRGEISEALAREMLLVTPAKSAHHGGKRGISHIAREDRISHARRITGRDEVGV